MRILERFRGKSKRATQHAGAAESGAQATLPTSRQDNSALWQLTEAQRRWLESVESLRRGAYTKFNDRRIYEWKLSLAVWAALAVLIAGLVQPSEANESFPLQGPGVWIAAALMGAIGVLLHVYWSHGAAKANEIDKRAELRSTRAMESLLSLPQDEDLERRIASHPKRVGWDQWSHLAQIGITTLLALAVAVIVYIRAS